MVHVCNDYYSAMERNVFELVLMRWMSLEDIIQSEVSRKEKNIAYPSHAEGQEGWREEITLIQGKEQRLRFAGAAVKTYPTSKVRETQVKW